MVIAEAREVGITTANPATVDSASKGNSGARYASRQIGTIPLPQLGILRCYHFLGSARLS